MTVKVSSFITYRSRVDVDLLQNFEFSILSAAFDGIEGNSPATGAVIDNTIFTRLVEEKKVNCFFFLLNFRKDLSELLSLLEQNNSYSFFSSFGAAIETGYTGTNVNDMLMIILSRKS